ncbi:MAG: UDP-N-acetylmuramoyl-tripeptide--D-alanyl-D-alanine ligase [Firmicutes bacterium]|nr:UDP-N-acetylmuramoyl-tripeptide--D-alanyl-D-alanine ligase [Bacillota bacterium]
MEPMTLAQIAELAGAALVTGDRESVVYDITTDSRQVRPGEIFWALRGERFDGHDFSLAAARAGALGLVCEQGQLHRIRAELADSGLNDTALLVVEDTLLALQQLAREYRRLFSLPVVAVTGSAGKTTTKDLTAGVLSTRYPTLKTPGNFNNEIGLPLTLLELNQTHEALVVEMGMRGSGQIAALAQIAVPTVGIVTNVHPVHLELLGSMSAIAAAKGELIQALPREGYGILNADDPLVMSLAEDARCSVLTFGKSPQADLQILQVTAKGQRGIVMDFAYLGSRYEAVVPIPGAHNASNGAAAILAGVACGLTVQEAVRGLANYSPSPMRMEVATLPNGTVLVNDAYNANPAAMEAAIDTVAQMERDKPLWLVLGDMLELGDLAESAHRQVGCYAGKSGAERLIVVGEFAELMAQGAREAGMPADRIHLCADATEARTVTLSLPWQARVILVKASRGVGLEAVVNGFKEADVD